MRTEKLKKTILTTFGTKEFYGYEIHKILHSKNLTIGVSRLYRILNDMLKDGLLNSKWEQSNFGPKRKIYKIGKKGRTERQKILHEAISTIHKFYAEYLNSLPPQKNVLDLIVSLLPTGIKKKKTLAF